METVEVEICRGGRTVKLDLIIFLILMTNELSTPRSDQFIASLQEADVRFAPMSTRLLFPNSESVWRTPSFLATSLFIGPVGQSRCAV